MPLFSMLEIFDHNNTLQDITTARGEEQCDEDDYGYESAMSQQIFSKLADRYANMPEDDKLKFVKRSKGSIDDIKVRLLIEACNFV